MFDFDTLKPGVLVEPEGLMARRKDLRKLAVTTPIHTLRRRPPLLFAPETSVAAAARAMGERGIPASLVVCSGTVLGLLTEANITNLLQDPTVDLTRISVWKAMTPEPPFCWDTDSIASVLRLFKSYDVLYLPMVQRFGPVTGVVEMASVLEWLSDGLAVVGLD